MTGERIKRNENTSRNLLIRIIAIKHGSMLNYKNHAIYVYPWNQIRVLIVALYNIMTQNIQYIIIGVIVGWAGIYLLRRLYNTFNPPKDGCGGGCGCATAELKKQK